MQLNLRVAYWLVKNTKVQTCRVIMFFLNGKCCYELLRNESETLKVQQQKSIHEESPLNLKEGITLISSQLLDVAGFWAARLDCKELLPQWSLDGKAK